jgi:hypothetical protein
MNLRRNSSSRLTFSNYLEIDENSLPIKEIHWTDKSFLSIKKNELMKSKDLELANMLRK